MILLKSSSVPIAPLSFISSTSSSQPVRLMCSVEKFVGPWHFVHTERTTAFPSPSGKAAAAGAFAAAPDEAVGVEITAFAVASPGVLGILWLSPLAAAAGKAKAKAMRASEFL